MFNSSRKKSIDLSRLLFQTQFLQLNLLMMPQTELTNYLLLIVLVTLILQQRLEVTQAIGLLVLHIQKEILLKILQQIIFSNVRQPIHLLDLSL